MSSVKFAAGTLRTTNLKDKMKSCCHCESALPVAETCSHNVTTAASTFLLCLSVTEAPGFFALSSAVVHFVSFYNNAVINFIISAIQLHSPTSLLVSY